MFIDTWINLPRRAHLWAKEPFRSYRSLGSDSHSPFYKHFAATRLFSYRLYLQACSFESDEIMAWRTL